MTRREFSIISHYFDRKITSRLDVEVGIGDDCALLNIPEGYTLAISTDTLISGHHFLPNIDPSDLAYKSLAVNLSDLASMGANPAWIMLSLIIPEVNESWLEVFSNTLFKYLNYYNIQLIGGNTTAGMLSITLVIYGFVPVGSAIKRSGANPGDHIYVTGTIGDSAAGLAILQNRLSIQNEHDKMYLIQRHLHPIPRIRHGQILRKWASAAIDISDGLISDLDHILNASMVGARIDLDTLLFSSEMRRNVDPEQALHWALSGGEDYELLFTVPEFHCNAVDALLKKFSIPCTCIGKIQSDCIGIQFFQKGNPISLDIKSYDHFSK